MVVVRKGCGVIGGSESLIFDIEIQSPWYILLYRGLVPFLKSEERVESLIVTLFKGCCVEELGF